MSFYLLIEPPEEGIMPDELMHHGILGMKWGVRRFQPYGPGQKVKGGKEVGLATKVKQRVTGIKDGIKQHKAAKQKAAQVKKAQATRKANTDYAEAKKKAIESGSIEDLAKFKGDLTNEEYGRAFARLQNEKKMADMVAANQTSAFDKIDKGMEVVKKLAGYANTVADFKEKTDRMSDALNKSKKEAADKKKEAEKNTALTNVTNLTELNEVQKKYNLNADEYSKGLKIASTKKANQKLYGDDFVDKNTPVEGTYKKDTGNVAEKASYDNSNPSDFKKPPKTIREKAAYVNPDGERSDVPSKEERERRKLKGAKILNSNKKYYAQRLSNFVG